MFALSALKRLLRTEEESAGEKKEEGGGKERERGIARARLIVVATFSTAPMAGGAVVVQEDPWGLSDVSMATL